MHQTTLRYDPGADAMVVLEKCLEQGEVELWHNHNGYHVMDLVPNRGDGETLTLAICRFAEEMVKDLDTK